MMKIHRTLPQNIYEFSGQGAAVHNFNEER